MTTQAGTGSSYAAVTPSDSTIVGATALYIGTTGDVTLKFNANATPVTFKTVPVGLLPVSAYQVMATNTTATNIVSIF